MGNSNRNRVSQQQAIAERNRSYNVREQIAVGSTVRFLRDCYHGEQIKRGQRGTVRHFYNAGFQGILATIDFEDGHFVVNVPAGILVVA